MEESERQGATLNKLRVAFGVGAAVWFFLLSIQILAPGGWLEGIARPIGHVQSYLVPFWFVTLVLSPLFACLSPLGHRMARNVYAVAMLAIVVCTFLAGAPKVPRDASPIAGAALSAGLTLWANLD